jgi:hypothetical protein
VKRLLFNVLIGASSVLFAATMVMWVRSYWASDQLTFESNKVVSNQTRMTSFQLFSTRDELLLQFGKGVGRANPSAAISWLKHTSGPVFRMRMQLEELTFLHRSGFRFSSGKSDNGFVNGVWASWSWGFLLSMPYWFLALVFLVLPARRFVGALSRRPLYGNLCAKCHYDLRATPDRCPECGTIVEKSR